MNDPKNPKNPPPDDFSKTTPYIRAPKNDLPSEPSSDYTSDWEKTNFNFSPPPRQTPPPARSSDDDWGKTAVNINIPRASPPEDDFGKTFMPGQMPPSQSQSNQPRSDWDMTQAGFNINQNDFGDAPRQQQQNDFGATVPLIHLPESERAKLLGQPPPAAPNPAEQTSKKAATPAWVWFAGVAGIFLLLAATIVGAYFVFSRSYGYDVIVKGAQPNSDVFVDGTRWQLTSTDGSYRLSGLSAGTHKIEIKHPNFIYEVEQVTGNDGDKPKEIVAKSKPVAVEPPKPDECKEIKKGDFAKASKCANDALDKLGENFTVQQLLDAMNLYIINFDRGKFDIKPNDMQFLEKSAGYMKKLPPNVKIEVGGHTDSDGSDAANQALSENRAKAVRDAFVKLGIKTETLEMRGYGEARPKPGNTNANDDEKFQNRRIEYTAIIR